MVDNEEPVYECYPEQNEFQRSPGASNRSLLRSLPSPCCPAGPTCKPPQTSSNYEKKLRRRSGKNKVSCVLLPLIHIQLRKPSTDFFSS